MSVANRCVMFSLCLLALAGCGGSDADSNGAVDAGSQGMGPDQADNGGAMDGDAETGYGLPTDAGSGLTPSDAGTVAMDAGTTQPDAGTMVVDAGPQLPAGDWIDVGQGPKSIDASKTRCGYEQLVDQYLFRAIGTDLRVGIAFDAAPTVADYAVVDYYKAPYGSMEVGSVARIGSTDYDSVGGGTVKYLGGTPIRIQLLNASVKSTGGVTRTVSAQFTCPAGTVFRPSLAKSSAIDEGDREAARRLLVD